MDKERPRVEITEQPADKPFRFRYKGESKHSTILRGINSMRNRRSFPTIKITGYEGRAKVIVSCVTENAPYYPHPYSLVGKNCKDGICMTEFMIGRNTLSFPDLSIQRVGKLQIKEKLEVREELNVDPFRTGFKCKERYLDINTVRLCFQVFLQGSQQQKFNVPLAPVVSTPIYHKRVLTDLVIHKLSHCSASVAGGQNVILLCNEVKRKDIQVRFFEEKDGLLIWQGYGDSRSMDVYKSVAITFKTPRYHTQNVTEPVEMYVQLQRPSDSSTSKPLPFRMLPLNETKVRSKRQRLNSNIGQSVYSLNVTETKTYDRAQPSISDIIETESTNRISLFDNEVADIFTLKPVTKESHSDVQAPMPQMPPRYHQVFPEPQTFPYVSIPEQEHLAQYRLLGIDGQPSSDKEINQMELNQTETNPYIMNRITQACNNITNIRDENEILPPSTVREHVAVINPDVRSLDQTETNPHIMNRITQDCNNITNIRNENEILLPLTVRENFAVINPDVQSLDQTETNPYIMNIYNRITQDCNNITNMRNENEILLPLTVRETVAATNPDVQLLDMDTHCISDWKPLDSTDIEDLDLASLSGTLSSELCLTDCEEAAPTI